VSAEIVPADSPRILELRRRVQVDPASIAFAQLAEELRRTGANEEAVGVCQAGLARHPGYLSARVTLGRALIELGRLTDALAALETVSDAAPDNLAAIRGLAEIHQQRGDIAEALKYYRRALELARHDPELEETVERMEKEIAPRPERAVAELETSVEALFDFDRLVEELGAETAGPPPAAAVVPMPEGHHSLSDNEPGAATAAAQPADPNDPLATLETALREHEQHPPSAPADAPLETGQAHDEKVDARLSELENWLQALRTDRS
jgi:tetratricopeptide (TPR) repeat protein